jgi:SRSO17 transposase
MPAESQDQSGRGLMQARRKNMERMAEVVPESDEQALQHFLSNSNGDARGILDQVPLEADALLGGTEESALLIDESGISKKGNESVGVARQWNGRLGKVDTCQVGVCAALSRSSHQRVWVWDRKEAQARPWHSIVRRERVRNTFGSSNQKSFSHTPLGSVTLPI